MLPVRGMPYLHSSRFISCRIMKYLGIIPARYASSRFPGKPLVDILGKPLIIHVAEKAVAALGKDHVVVATEDERIYREVEKWGFRAVMTTDRPLTGTDRLWEVAQQMPADVYINIQGDEPMVDPTDILRVLEVRKKHPDKIVNGYVRIGADEDPDSPHLPKVIFSEAEDLIYMSRKALPGSKSGKNDGPFYKQVCIYAFTFNELRAFGERTEKTWLESHEDIEILRFLEMGYPVKMVEMSAASLAVDIPADVHAVEMALKNKA